MATNDDAPRNRKERRAAARESGKPMAAPTSTPKLKLSQPNRSGPTEKTLLDLYEEKKSLLTKGQPFDEGADQTVMDEGGNILEAGLGDGEPIGPIGQAIFWTFTLGMMHFTFDVLVHNQYKQEMEWTPIFQRTATIIPVLFLMVYLLRSELAARFDTAKQLFYLVVAVASGCYTIQVTNEYDYFYVMKQTPPLGTLWIWSVIEMKLAYGAASVACNLAYLWWKNYTIF
ncbi:hypothetical protein LTR78_000507 [Recurvomyces mirabilis]|uniref:DUF7719 domain-containing protein n=1 Tax=Recurvomyces mirabilis TaxID=574656 RepID=A0AAE0WXD7_9PEZI|nr:hypothetical protein LTR78_000507 [Recurvomyces mirabilis]KAK5162162.1 hypothetical protein LTS14_000508 [Recurvomyces mirabilis]